MSKAKFSEEIRSKLKEIGISDYANSLLYKFICAHPNDDTRTHKWRNGIWLLNGATGKTTTMVNRDTGDYWHLFNYQIFDFFESGEFVVVKEDGYEVKLN